jgi:CRP-like cAMP-binding protein
VIEEAESLPFPSRDLTGMPPSTGPTIRNRILSALPRADLEQLGPHLQPVSLPLRQILQEAGAAIEHVYFIEQGLASVLTMMADGEAIEVRMVGRESIIGLAYLLGAEVLPQQVIVQVSGSAWRMSAALFKAEFDRRETLRRIVLRLVNAALVMTSQNAACNRLHSVEQRCARWLLEASNRISSDSMPMTHEFLSSLLGVRRAGITATASQFQRSGLIRYHRGRLTIVDREALEACACECYLVDHKQFEWEKPPRRRGRPP